MALFPIVVAGVQIGLIDTNDRFSKDPGPNFFPQAAPNTPTNVGGTKSVQANFNSLNGSGQITSVINNVG